MTRTGKTHSALIATILALVFALSTCILSFAEEAPSVDQKVYVVQIVTHVGEGKDIEGTEGLYVLIPDKETNPMPPEGNVVELAGNKYQKLNITFTEPGTYQYTLGKVKESSLKKDVKDITVEDFEEGERNEAGELVRPLTHVFGFIVDENLNVTPYTCDDPTNTPLNDGTGISLWNYVYAKDKTPEPSTEPSSEPSSKPTEKPADQGCTCKPGSGCNCSGSSGRCNCSDSKGCSCTTTKKDDPKPEPTTDKDEPTTEKPATTTTTKQPTSVAPVTNKNNEPVTNSNGSVRTTVVYVNNGSKTTTTSSGKKRGSNVNTGDESHLVLWVAIAGIAVASMIILLVIRRKHDDEEETM